MSQRKNNAACMNLIHRIINKDTPFSSESDPERSDDNEDLKHVNKCLKVIKALAHDIAYIM